jgi:taurine dioxygenase
LTIACWSSAGSFSIRRRKRSSPTAGAKFFHAPYLKQLEIPDHSEVMAQPNLGKANSFTTEVWHSDLSFMPAPPAHSILAAQVLPEAGGDTMFANQYSAYETLSEGMKHLLRELRAWHGGSKLASLLEVENSVPPQSHPIVRTHPETGRKGLYVNRLYTYCIDGLTEAESRGLLDFLFEQNCRPEFTYRHQWTPGDVIMWDNRCALHYAVHDYGEAARVMHRTTIEGDIPPLERIARPRREVKPLDEALRIAVTPHLTGVFLKAHQARSPSTMETTEAVGTRRAMASPSVG